MIKKYLASMVALLSLTIIPSMAMAKPLVNISVKAEMDIVVKEGGQNITKRVVAKNVTTGYVLFYTVSFRNDGTEKATNAVIYNPIPKDTKYIEGSAYGEGADITFSIDKGKTYNKPSLLFYQLKDKDGKPVMKIASPDIYTNIKWVIPVIEKGQKGTVGFKTIVK